MSQGEQDGGRPQGPCRVLLVEDDEPLRDRFARFLEAWPGGVLIAACATLGHALQVLNRQSVDLLITDLRLPDGDGTQVIRKLRQLNPQADALVISVLANELAVIEAIEAGAAGYLLKDADSIELIEAIEELLAGGSPISSSIARVLVRRLSALSAGSSRDAEVSPERPAVVAEGGNDLLTPREMEVLWGIAKGFTYAELAQRLGISAKTVAVHVRHVYRKLEAGNRSEAVYEASRLGLIRL